MTDSELPDLQRILLDDDCIEHLSRRDLIAIADGRWATDAAVRYLAALAIEVDEPVAPGGRPGRAADGSRPPAVGRAIVISQRWALAMCLAVMPLGAGVSALLTGDPAGAFGVRVVQRLAGHGTRPVEQQPLAVSPAPARLGVGILKQPTRPVSLSVKRSASSRGAHPGASDLSWELANPVQSEVGASREPLVPGSSWPTPLRAALRAKYALPTVPVWAGRGPASPELSADLDSQ